MNIYFIQRIIEGLENRLSEESKNQLIEQLKTMIKLDKKKVQFKNSKIIPSLTNTYDRNENEINGILRDYASGNRM